MPPRPFRSSGRNARRARENRFAAQESIEVVGEFRGRAVAVRGIVGDGLHHHGVEFAAGEPVVVFPEGRRKSGDTLVDLFDGPAFLLAVPGDCAQAGAADSARQSAVMMEERWVTDMDAAVGSA